MAGFLTLPRLTPPPPLPLPLPSAITLPVGLRTCLPRLSSVGRSSVCANVCMGGGVAHGLEHMLWHVCACCGLGTMRRAIADDV